MAKFAVAGKRGGEPRSQVRQLFRRAGELERRTEGAARECDTSLFECAGKDLLNHCAVCGILGFGPKFLSTLGKAPQLGGNCGLIVPQKCAP